MKLPSKLFQPLPYIYSRIPPVFIQVYRKNFKKYSFKEFGSYEEAVKSFGSYDDKSIINVVSQKTRTLISDLGQKEVDNQLLQNISVFQHVLLDNSAQKLHIVDLGGACGAYYFLLSSYYPNRIGIWNVVETTPMVNEAKKLFENKTLRFFDNLNKALDSMKKIDLCIAQGVLQYVPNPIETLQSLFAHNFKYIFISRQPLGINIEEPIITKQISPLLAHGPGTLKMKGNNITTSFPITIIPEKIFNSLIQKYSYSAFFNYVSDEEYIMEFPRRSVMCKVISLLLRKE